MAACIPLTAFQQEKKSDGIKCSLVSYGPIAYIHAQPHVIQQITRLVNKGEIYFNENEIPEDIKRELPKIVT